MKTHLIRKATLAGLYKTLMAAMVIGVLLTLPAPARAGLDGDGDLDAVFANGLQSNRVCLGDGLGGFACGDVSADTRNSRGMVYKSDARETLNHFRSVARAVAQTHPIGLELICKDGVEDAVAVHVPQRHAAAASRIRADIATGKAAQAVAQTHPIGG